MRATIVLVSLGLLLVGSRVDSAGPATLEALKAGRAVVGAPTLPVSVTRLPPVYLHADPIGAFPTTTERVLGAAKYVLADQFRGKGWREHDPNNAVESFVRTPEGQQMLMQTVDKFGPDGTPKYTDPAIQTLAYAAGRRGVVQVITEPLEVSVLLDNSLQGETEVEFWCDPGQYELTLEKPGYKSQTQTILVQSGRITTVEARMAR